jgi:hypothetical protein
MGATLSAEVKKKESPPPPPQDELNQTLVNKLDVVRQIVKAYNDNDNKALLDLIGATQNQYSVAFPENLTKYIKTFHEKILNNIESYSSVLTDEQKKALNLENKTPEETKAILKQEQMKRNNFYAFLNSIETKHNEENLAQLKGILKTEMPESEISPIFKDLISLRTKYKFFEYEYVNLNLFLILFIQNTLQSSYSIADKVVTILKERDEKHHKMLSDLIKLLLSIMSASDFNINPAEIDKINEMMKKAEETAGQKHDGLRKQIGGAIENELVNVMNKALEQSQGNASKDATIVGGFFRDGSMLPQSFYDL